LLSRFEAGFLAERPFLDRTKAQLQSFGIGQVGPDRLSDDAEDNGRNALLSRESVDKGEFGWFRLTKIGGKLCLRFIISTEHVMTLPCFSVSGYPQRISKLATRLPWSSRNRTALTFLFRE